MSLIDEMNPFNRAITLYEKRKNISKTIADMKRKYVTLKQLQHEMELEDHEMDDMIADMKRKNRYSNKYVFTELDGEPAVGVAASKRKRKQNLGDPLSDTEQNAGDDSSDHPGKGKGKTTVAVSQGDMLVGKRRSHKKKMGKVAKLVNDYTNQHESEELGESMKEKYTEHFKSKMKEEYDTEKLGELTPEQKSAFFKSLKSSWKKAKKEYVDENHHFELRRKFQRGGWGALMNESTFPSGEQWKTMSAEEVIREMATVVVEDQTRYLDMISRGKRPKVMGHVNVTKEFKDKNKKPVRKGVYTFLIADAPNLGKVHLLVSSDEKETFEFSPQEYQSHFRAGHITK